ncbi:MAG: urease accessory protein UreE [Prochlorotrichaceae cyanobacterium]|jgi:urease accessory protein
MKAVVQLNQCCSPLEPPTPVVDTLSLCAADRQRSLGQGVSNQGCYYQWRLPRGSSLLDQAYLGTPKGDRWVQVVALPEPVLTVTSDHPLHLLQAAYHLGNRHVALEITATYLRLAPDPVLLHLLRDHLQVTVTEEIVPFHPILGAYHSPGHAH